MNNARAGIYMKEASEKYLKYWQVAWKGEKEYLENLRISYKDAADLFCIGQYLEEDNFEKARKLAWNLDTAVREEIPDDVWDYLTE